MSADAQRFTEKWDALDPYDETYPHLWIKVEHLGRYLFAARYLQLLGVKVVADIGCGTGYGAGELAGSVEKVLALDSEPQAVSEARTRYGADNIHYVEHKLGSGQANPLLDEIRWDAVVCFETLEHLADPASALKEIAKYLHVKGTLILSVPNSVAEYVNDAGLPTNRRHKRIYSISSITDVLSSTGFIVDEVLGQPLAAEINRNEAQLIRRKQADGRIGDNAALHDPTTLRRLAMAIGFPEARDVERSYSITIVASRSA